MVQVTSWFTGIDIHTVRSTGNLKNPYHMKKGNLGDRDKDCGGLPIWIGYINSIQYQSLLPTYDKFLAPRSCARKAKVEAQKRQKSQEMESKITKKNGSNR